MVFPVLVPACMKRSTAASRMMETLAVPAVFLLFDIFVLAVNVIGEEYWAFIQAMDFLAEHTLSRCAARLPKRSQ